MMVDLQRKLFIEKIAKQPKKSDIVIAKNALFVNKVLNYVPSLLTSSLLDMLAATLLST